MHVAELTPLTGAVSWTDKAFVYYVHTIDRTLVSKKYCKDSKYLDTQTNTALLGHPDKCKFRLNRTDLCGSAMFVLVNFCPKILESLQYLSLHNRHLCCHRDDVYKDRNKTSKRPFCSLVSFIIIHV